MKAFLITVDIFAAAVFISLVGMMYVDYWREKNKKRKPYNFEDQERIMKSCYPDDPEIDFCSWRKYIFSQRQLMN